MFRKFLTSLFYNLLSPEGAEIPGAVETFVKDYSSPKTLDPEWSRLEDLFIKSCNEHPSIIYIVLGGVDNMPDEDREAIVQTIGKLWDIKRVKLLISISNAFFNTFLSRIGKKLTPSEKWEITPNEEDIRIYSTSRLGQGPSFLHDSDVKTEILTKLIEK